MKSFLALFFYFLFLHTYSQTELEKLKQVSSKICTTEQDLLFCKAFEHYNLNAYDSCYIFSSKALRNESNKEKREILNYFQGYSAIQKGLLKKALLNINEISDDGLLKNLKKLKLGYIHLQNKSYKKAIENYLALISREEKLSYEQLKNVYHNLGISYLLDESYKEAKIYLDKELQMTDKKDTASVIGLKTDLANIYYQQYMDEKAIPLFYEAYSLARTFSDIDKKRITSKNLAVVEFNRENYNKSVVFYRELIKWKDSVWNRDKVWELAELDKTNAIKSKEQELLLQRQKMKRQQIIMYALIIISSLILIIGFLVYKSRKKRLLFEAEIQKLKVVEEERKRISEELHDGVLGKLFGIRMNLGLINNLEKENQFNIYLDELQQVEKEIRNVSHELGTHIPEISNFNLSIEQLMEAKSRQGDFNYNLEFFSDFNFKNIDTSILINIYRVLQEVLHNVVKHAKATHVSLFVKKEDENLVLNIKDDGVGFDVDLSARKGIGLQNILSRVKKIKGNVNIDSKINLGTVTELRIPC